jgi:hypothetical protein
VLAEGEGDAVGERVGEVDDAMAAIVNQLIDKVK